METTKNIDINYLQNQVESHLEEVGIDPHNEYPKFWGTFLRVVIQNLKGNYSGDVVFSVLLDVVNEQLEQMNFMEDELESFEEEFTYFWNQI